MPTTVTFTAGSGVRRFELGAPGQQVVLGRSQRADLCISSPRLSRLHCAVRLGSRGLQVEDLGSSNGTYVNGQRIQQALLRPGDIVQVGGIAIRVDFDPAVAADVDLRCERCNRMVSMARCEDGQVFDVGGRFLCPECAQVMRYENLTETEQLLIAALEEEGYAIEGKSPLSQGIVPVFRARRKGLGDLVALKALPLLAGVSDKKITRFKAEARAAARLRHPGVLQIYDIRQMAAALYIVMEHLEGELLLGLIERKKALDLRETLRVGLHVTRALVAARKHGIVHRDLKPAGILLAADGTPKVADFGLAKDLWALAGEVTGPEETLGTVRYMPPEQVKNARSADHRADIYSLGATLYHAATGVPPYSDRKELELIGQVLSGTLPPFDPTRADLHPALAQLLARALRPAPEERFQTPEELEQALGACVAEVMGAPGFKGDPDLLLSMRGEGETTWRGRVPRPGGMSGVYRGHELVEFLQLVDFHGKTGLLAVRAEGLTGHMAFQDGHLAAAITSQGHTGLEAARALIGTRAGSFEFTPELPRNFTPTLRQKLGAVLLDALRLRDEQEG